MKHNKTRLKNVLLFLGGMLLASGAQGQVLVTDTFAFTGTVQSMSIPPCVSQMTLEVWGAEGGGSTISGNTNSGPGGKGGYARGILNVTPVDSLHIYVGGSGQSSTLGIAPGGWNGGGGANATSAAEPGNGGGGATDIRLNGRAYSDRVIVAGGGGGGGEDPGDDHGHGGGLTGVGYTTYDATQTAAGPGFGSGIGVGASTNMGDGGGGGGGYYGGGSINGNGSSGTDTQGGGGGSGYIGGVQNGTLIAGNTSMPNPNGGNMQGRSYNGFVRISYISAQGGTLSVTSSATLCPGQNVTLSGMVTPGISTFTWEPVGSFSGSNDPTISVSPSSNTTYSVSGTHSFGCVYNTLIDVTVHPVPVMSAVSSPSVICRFGDPATLIASGAMTYTWTGLSTSQSATVITSASTPTYSYTGGNEFGCTTTGVFSLPLNTNSLVVTAPSLICEGAMIEMEASGVGSYTWSTGSYYHKTFVTPQTTTTFSVSGTDASGCVLSETVLVQVNPRPSVMVGADRNNVCRGESLTLTATGADTYVWSTGETTDQISVNLPVDIIYNYTLTGTGSNGCKTSTVVSVVVSRCTGIGEQEPGLLSARIYPNPARDAITIETPEGQTCHVEITDVTGRVILSRPDLSAKAVVDISTLPAGVYYVKLQSGDDKNRIKLLKQD
jgi:hypothetical protein